MEDNMINVTDSDNEKQVKLQGYIENIKSKKNKFLFCVPDVSTPNALMYEIYFHANIVKDMGYDVIMLTEKEEFIIPTWIETELTNLNHVTMVNSKLTVAPDDIMVIPELFTNIMEQTKDLPCMRVGLLQSIDYMLNGLLPGVEWRTFNISDIITTSKSLKEFVEVFLGKNKYNILDYKIGIPEYFSKSENPQKPIISIVGRNPNEISKFIKLFYSKYPQFSWVTFDPMLTKSKPPQPMRRVDFANRLKDNFAAVWIDRISSFGTFPLECMKCGVIPICLKPDVTPEYILERNEEGIADKINSDIGVWTNDFFELPILLGEVLTKYLDDNINSEFYDKMSELALKYNVETSKESLTAVYNQLIEKRISLFEKAII